MGDEAETKPELPAEILRCPACNGAAFRDVVLKRCNHTFCRSCLDLRLSNRQRKCPACDEQFAKSDMQTFMLQ
ncbi:hypothetical protein B0H16DRAFT_1526385 [Mycena metata]|uniref:E3 ubiquitin protein ligase n=1 Tax=Mycena metata TaxID=1033252 RepID=A0AAD7JK56_9AGAR|nr:hypothetical protein B0H16DRAFT_1526385 [Mycena metata]